MTILDNEDYIRVLLYSYHSTLTGWEVLLSYSSVRVISYKGIVLSVPQASTFTHLPHPLGAFSAVKAHFSKLGSDENLRPNPQTLNRKPHTPDAQCPAESELHSLKKVYTESGISGRWGMVIIGDFSHNSSSPAHSSWYSLSHSVNPGTPLDNRYSSPLSYPLFHPFKDVRFWLDASTAKNILAIVKVLPCYHGDASPGVAPRRP